MPAAFGQNPQSARSEPRRRAGLLLSVALHLAVLAVVVRVQWLTHEAPAARELDRAVWLELPKPPVEPPVEATGDAVPEVAAAAMPPQDATAPPAEPRAPRAERPASPKSRVRRAAPPAEERPSVPAAPVETPSSQRPPVDWEEERRKAVASIVAERESPRHYVTFSADDYIAPPAPIEPVPPPFVDDCVIAHGRLQTFMAQMMGRCVRDARGDLFASIMPEYLTARPQCSETHPESPGSVLADGTEISTVKCALVARAERP
jgi:hypothetical protein